MTPSDDVPGDDVPSDDVPGNGAGDHVPGDDVRGDDVYREDKRRGDQSGGDGDHGHGKTTVRTVTDALGRARTVDRAVSTVLDVGLCLLLVSAAVGVLYVVPDGPPDERGDVAAPAATTVATSTATVEYQSANADRRRVDRGTVAALLARAAVANATLDGEPVTGDEAYVDAVRARSTAALAGVAGAARVRVRAQWRPVPGSDLRGTVAVGPEPPPGADVHAATLSVPVGDGRGTGVRRGRPEREQSARGGRPTDASATALRAAAARDDCRAFGRRAARRVVGVLFPLAPTDAALDGGSGAVTRERYATAAATLGTDPVQFDRGADAAARNRLLADRLAPTLAGHCREAEEHRSPAEEGGPSSATVVVRTWSP